MGEQRRFDKSRKRERRVLSPSLTLPALKNHIENEDPQPQVLFAEGLLTLNPERCSSSW